MATRIVRAYSQYVPPPPDPDPGDTTPPPPTQGYPYPIFGSSVYDGAGAGTWAQQFDRSQVIFDGMAGVRIFVGFGGGCGNWTGGHVGTVLNKTRNMVIYHSFKDWNEGNIRTFFRTKPDDGRMVYTSYHHEPDGGRGVVDFPDPRVWVNRHVRVRQIWREEGSRADIRLIPILIRHTLSKASGRNIMDWMPADPPAVWDEFWMDAYGGGGATSHPSVAGLLDPIVAHAKSIGLPWGIGEFGQALKTTHEARATWITQYCNYAVQHKASGCMYWSATTSADGFSSRIDEVGSEPEQNALATFCVRSRQRNGITRP